MRPIAGKYPPAMSTGGDDLGNYYARLPIEDENQEAGVAHELEEGEVAPRESEMITCHLCHRVFMSKKALHGHMRSHPARRGRGSAAPSMEEETAELLLLLSGSGDPLHRKYLGHDCNEELETSHRKRQGSHANAKDSGRPRGGGRDDEAAESSRRGRKNKRPLLDLNKPPSPSPSGSDDGSGGGSESSSSDDAGEEKT